jgi:hypothetical protein
VTEKGIIQFGDSIIEADPTDIRALKTILDKLRIYHIIDDVAYYSPVDAAARMKALYKVKVWKVERDGSVSLKNRFGHSGRFQYRHLILPGFYEINFTGLLLLDVDEAEFIGDLVYGSE